MRGTSIGATIPRTAQLSNDILVKTTAYALCTALVFVLLVGEGSADTNNTAPVLDPIPTTTISETETATIVLIASDPDDDPITYSTNALFGTLSGNTFTWETSYGDSGSYNIEFTVSDGNLTDTETGVINVGNANKAPVLDTITTVTINETETATIVLSASDPDGDTLTYSTNAAFGSIRKNTFTWSTGYGDSGTYNIEFTVSDGDLTDTETGVINVENSNRAPVLSPIGDQSINENTQLSLTVSASDDEGETLTYSAVDLPTGATLDGLTGLFTWIPTYDQARTYSVQFSVTDGTYIDSETVAIKVNDVNRPPILDSIGSKSVNENIELSFTVSASDEDSGDSLTYSAVDMPNGANFDSSTRLFTWTPAFDQAGTYSVQFSVTDETDVDSETVTITVNNVNRAPILVSIGSKSVDENIELSFTVSAEDEDTDDTITYSAVDLPTGATLNSLTGVFSWTPAFDQAGTYPVQFSVTDETDIDSETVTITVNNVNRVPILNPIGSKSVDENIELSFTVSSSDEDTDDTITYSAVDLPTNATLNSSSGVFEWTPAYDQARTYSVQFSVTDGTYSDSETVAITVNDVNRAPALDSITGILINEAETATIVLVASDPDGDTITYSTNATFGVLTDNTFTWTSGYKDDGIYYLKFTVSDGDLTDTEIGVIVVGDADRPPVLNDIGSKSANQNKELSFTLNATDLDGDILIYSAIGLPTGANLNGSSGLFKWIPSDTQAGTYNVIFQVTDQLLQDSETVKITVDGVNTISAPTGFGGGSGRSVVSTGEEFENIEVRDVIRVYVHKDSTIVYNFKEEINAIDLIKFDAKISAGYVAATIEVLKDTSAIVSTAPPGEVYQNMNIWIGNAIYATGDRIENPIIEFKVARSWITENNIDISKIQLCRYSSDAWNSLPTTKINEDKKYIYFTSKTPGFSPFAITEISDTPITNKMTENMSATYFTPPSTLSDDAKVPVSETADVPNEQEKSAPFALIIGLIGISALIAVIVVKKEEIKGWIDQKRDSSWDWE